MTTARDLLAADRTATMRRLAALEREFGGIVESAGQANTDDEHDPEGATIAFERQHVAALLGQAQERLTEIDAALRRLDGGTYGACERCGQPIGTGRLAVRPSASTCVRCAAQRLSASRTHPDISHALRPSAMTMLTALPDIPPAGRRKVLPVMAQAASGSPLNTWLACQDTWTAAGGGVPGRGNSALPCRS